jgi:hypothetical protein
VHNLHNLASTCPAVLPDGIPRGASRRRVATSPARRQTHPSPQPAPHALDTAVPRAHTNTTPVAMPSTPHRSRLDSLELPWLRTSFVLRTTCSG